MVESKRDRPSHVNVFALLNASVMLLRPEIIFHLSKNIPASKRADIYLWRLPLISRDIMSVVPASGCYGRARRCCGGTISVINALGAVTQMVRHLVPDPAFTEKGPRCRRRSHWPTFPVRPLNAGSSSISMALCWERIDMLRYRWRVSYRGGIDWMGKVPIPVDFEICHSYFDYFTDTKVLVKLGVQTLGNIVNYKHIVF